MRDSNTKVARLKGWGLYNGLTCLQGAPAWSTDLRHAVKEIILKAHVGHEADRELIRKNLRFTSRLMALKGFAPWLTTRAMPMTERELRRAPAQMRNAEPRAGNNPKERTAPRNTRGTATNKERKHREAVKAPPHPADDTTT